MRRSFTRGLALTATAGLLLAGCGEDQPAPDGQTGPETSDDQALDEQDLEDLLGDDGLEDPNEDVQDGVYRGNGVVLPVPEGWALDPAAFAQGVVAAISEDGGQQMTAQAVDASQISPEGGSLDFDELLDGIRAQMPQEPAVDEEVQLLGAERAHRLTYTRIPAQQEGLPEFSATILIAEDGDGLMGEFVFSAASDDYDEDQATLLVERAGFDPDSQPAQAPQPPQPAP